MPRSYVRDFGRNREILIKSDNTKTPNTEDDFTILELSSDPDDLYFLRIAASDDRLSLGTIADKEGFRLNFTSPATSGTARGLDLRLTQTGAGGESDCLRAVTTVSANTTNCRGAHISLDFLATAGESECSGTGTPVTFTLHIPDVGSWAPTGTLYGAQVQLWSDGTASDPAGLTTLACLALGNDGHADGRDDVDDDAFLLHLTGWTADTGSMFQTGNTAATVNAATTASLKILIGSTTYYIPIATAIV